MDRKILTILAAVFVLLITGISCSEDEDTQPELPPVDALVMDFSQFIDNPSPQKSMNLTVSFQNALYSYTTVAVWNVLVTAPMIVPVYA